jgi:long-chain fatty acid transport protein
MAAGFYLTQVGTPMSIGTVGVVNSVNSWGADTAWAQPAGMVDLKEDMVHATGVSLMAGKMEFDSSIAAAGGSDGGNASDPAIIPSHFIVKRLSDRTSMGLAVTAPIGGAMDYGDNFVGRYAATEVALQGLGISPSIGYKVNDQLSIGAGVSIIYSMFEQELAINRGPSSDGKVKMEDLDDWGYQPFFGLTYKFSEQLQLGVTYRAETETELEGDLKITGLPLPKGSVDIEWDNPQWLEAAISYDMGNNYFIGANLGWQEWSAFSENALTVATGPVDTVTVLERDWDDTWRTGVAFGHFGGDSGWSFGVSYDSSPVSDSKRTIDLPMDEVWQAGTSYYIKKEKYDLALSAALMYLGDGKVDQTAQGVRFKGEFDRNLLLNLGATFRYQF